LTGAIIIFQNQQNLCPFVWVNEVTSRTFLILHDIMRICGPWGEKGMYFLNTMF
jgi:hypothetical protein